MYNYRQLKYLFVFAVLFTTLLIYSFRISSFSLIYDLDIQNLTEFEPSHPRATGEAFNATANTSSINFNQSLVEDGSSLKENRARIFCIILSSEKHVLQRYQSVYDTWASRCDKFKFVLKMSPEFKQTANAIHPGLNDFLEPDGLIIDSYIKLPEKMFLTFRHLYSSSEYNTYDWYLKADDDSFIFVDNLREFVADKNASLPVTYGYDFKLHVKGGYHSGGGSYLLSHAAFTRLGRQLSKDFSFCEIQIAEDVDVARCLQRLHVYPNKSIDDTGRERFHPLRIDDHYHGTVPSWLLDYAANPVKFGLECCSDSTISFHYVDYQAQYKIAKFLAINKNSSRSGRMKFKDLVKYLNL